MTTVTGTITDATGGVPHGAAVVITLVDGEGVPTVGLAGDAEIIGQTSVTVSTEDGTWSAALTPTADISSPRGDTLYRVDETTAGGRGRYYISVPSSGSHWVGDLRVTLPGAAAEALTGYLALSGGTLTGALTLSGAPTQNLHAATKAYVDANAGGGGGAVSSVNEETGDVVLDAADVGADPAGTAAAAVATHAADTTSVHGIADTSALETASGAAAKVTAHAGATDPHGDRAYTDSTIAAHAGDTTSVHGIADTAALETSSGATAKVSAHAGAADPHGDRAYTDTAISTHAADTTSVHGIADTSALETATGSAAKVTAHAGATDPHGDRAYADGLVAALGDAAALDVGTTAGTVAAGDDARLSDARTPTAHAASHASGGSDPVTPAAIGAATSGHIHSQWTPSGHGLAAWTFDPAFIASGNGQQLPTAGVLQLLGVVLDSAATIASVALATAGTAGASLANSFVGLYDAAGTLRASTTDQSSSWQSAGFKNPSFSTPYAAPAGRYWIALLVGSATTLPSFHNSAFGNTNSSSILNVGLSAAAGTLRWGQYGSSQTALPASITPTSMVTTTVRAYWAALLT